MEPTRSLLILLDQAYDHASWHGTNLKGSIRGVTARQAAWRPGRGRHNVWEIAVHCAYWKYVARRRILREKRGAFSLEGSNWFLRTGAEGAGIWKADTALLQEMHALLRDAVVSLEPRDLRRRSATGRWTVLETVQGIASHDLYHAGQIQLVKLLQGR